MPDKKFIFICFLNIILWWLPNNCFAQQTETDSLKRLITQRKLNDTTKVDLYNTLAYSYYGSSIKDLNLYAKKAFLLSRQLKYKRGEAYAYKNIGLGCMLVNGDPMALKYFETSLKLFHQLNDKANEGRVLNNIGYYYNTLKDYNQSILYYQQALEKIAGLGKTHFESILQGNIGNNYVGLKNFKKAQQYYLEELRLAKITIDEDVLILSYANLASLAVMQQSYQQAIAYINKLQAYQNSPDFNQREKTELLLLMGQIQYGLKNYDKARKLYTAGYDLAKKTASIDQLLDYRYSFYLLDSAMGNYRAALQSSAIYHKISDSITNVNRNQLIALFQTRFELEKRKQENQHLQDAAAIDKATISRQRTKQLILLAILIIIVAGLFYFKKTYDYINKKNKIINQQNIELENAGHVKDKIFSVVSHDLRSPITQMVNLLGLWQQQEMDEREMKALTPVVINNIHNTLELLDNLLIWSKNQLQGFHYDPVPFQLDRLVEENIRSLYEMANNKGLTIQNNVANDVMVKADEDMIKIVLRNLISNAIKFTPQGGNIYIDSYIHANERIISVEDTGIGIQEKDLGKIFAFASHTTLGTNKEPGTGIGLKICYDFIQMNHGRMWVDSKANEGSTFYISFDV
ncbi:tetratricopeptide repeat-containing sensor histidine kinase [Mucilaginibacter phyllosphaerae]|uniref:histidine kinase n=1 Tax=Mucilaginibacter phyllosphaerae TaxID=1812349 RepID=A0A4Y8AJS2_9SPHI|nr:tetratricopeptide repeat-containing sensor histidine kinase [Mucilaginibacter phyllosphaerae]MBB3967666.1 signal transduction histidine kinase [Mucilaginibacter phyllosphaerae]TEW69278.1 sensor histidine kinase [Mucilaginibacter phyllosphaerae]GGH04117.1 hypothetical protein GCM10007352_07130 [Mucilaginibacter phyllosphaerae]